MGATDLVTIFKHILDMHHLKEIVMAWTSLCNGSLDKSIRVTRLWIYCNDSNISVILHDSTPKAIKIRVYELLNGTKHSNDFRFQVYELSEVKTDV